MRSTTPAVFLSSKADWSAALIFSALASPLASMVPKTLTTAVWRSALTGSALGIQSITAASTTIR
jgi:hypothetical protein